MPDGEAALRTRLSEVEAQWAQALEAVAAVEKENALLRQKIDLLVRKLFGAQSEPSGARWPKGGAFARRAAPGGALAKAGPRATAVALARNG